MTEFGEIIWVHPDIIKDEQRESNNPKLKGESCNVVSLAVNNVIVIIASLNGSEEEKLALVAQLAAPQPIGTWSKKQYLRQYNQTPDKTQQPATLGTIAPVQLQRHPRHWTREAK